MKRNDGLDLTKYFLSILVIAIHTGLGYLLYPWLRIAVPLFFMISSYLFFSRIKDKDEEVQKDLMKKYVKRNLQLYLFWFIVLLPVTIQMRKFWFEGSLLHVLRTVISNVLFSSTFIASWFIMASIEGMVIIFMTRKINWKIMLPLYYVYIVYVVLIQDIKYTFLIQ